MMCLLWKKERGLENWPLGRWRLDEKFNPEAETFRQDGERYRGKGC
jgi:hypothetical protein